VESTVFGVIQRHNEQQLHKDAGRPSLIPTGASMAKLPSLQDEQPDVDLSVDLGGLALGEEGT
jgi:hypothetical protein